jgi:hypothetical protein
MPKPLSPWAIEAKEHLQKYRPKMPSELQSQGKLDDWAQSAANRAVEESVQSTYNGMDPLEADRQAKLNHYLLPSEEDSPELGADPNALPDPASLFTTPGVNRRKKSAQRPQRRKNGTGPSLGIAIVEWSFPEAPLLLSENWERITIPSKGLCLRRQRTLSSEIRMARS